MSIPSGWDDVFDAAQQQTPPAKNRRSFSDLVFPIAFLSITGLATVTWVGGIGWALWRLLCWLSF